MLGTLTFMRIYIVTVTMSPVCISLWRILIYVLPQDLSFVVWVLLIWCPEVDWDLCPGELWEQKDARLLALGYSSRRSSGR